MTHQQKQIEQASRLMTEMVAMMADLRTELEEVCGDIEQDKTMRAYDKLSKIIATLPKSGDPKDCKTETD